jgi:hypothetical protein
MPVLVWSTISWRSGFERRKSTIRSSHNTSGSAPLRRNGRSVEGRAPIMKPRKVIA